MAPKCLVVLVILASVFVQNCLSRYDNPESEEYELNLERDDQTTAYYQRQWYNRRDGNYLNNYRPTLAARRPQGGSSSSNVFSVVRYGARGDGQTDDTQAFGKAWQQACSSGGNGAAATFMVPKNGVFLVKPVTFQGPCTSSVTVKIMGTIIASKNAGDFEKDRKYWLLFDNVNNVNVNGGGTIDGNGANWWRNSCKINPSKPCTKAPTAVTFNECKNINVENLAIQNAQQMHLTFMKCENVVASNLMVTSPGHSPNTDGIHVSGTQTISITNSVIKTGDDCISIVSGSSSVKATDITCGPGHGISIGSLGADNSEAHVSDVMVNRATISGTMNGVRIKTWQGGSGIARNIVFQNIVMNNVSNPIIIDQNYCDHQKCHQENSAVRIQNVMYSNIKGTSASDVAIKFDCSKVFGCHGIIMNNVNLVSYDRSDKTEAACDNVGLIYHGMVGPKC
uniref:endo-polygalacturonase n=1 Tax=Kalanchoe fedtschenkoi TaxID=63787 RepID=A0A7N0T3A8_KALFE